MCKVTKYLLRKDSKTIAVVSLQEDPTSVSNANKVIVFSVDGINNQLICDSWNLRKGWNDRLLPEAANKSTANSSYTRFLCREEFAVALSARAGTADGIISVMDRVMGIAMLELPYDSIKEVIEE